MRACAALWAGALWGVGYLAVPVLFASLEDRHLAGTLAGRMFQAVHLLGLACGAVLLLAAWRAGQRRRALALGALLAGVLVELLVLGPLVASAREQALAAGRPLGPGFGLLHGLASLLYLALALGALLVAALPPGPKAPAKGPGLRPEGGVKEGGA
ncbi:MAG: DUF4149 domain-containing protein [Gammaproteobacteria bacterium]|nr:MAG: DUF4149 domain-containing protein [Gammaproteobacteria bacterium]